MKLLSCRNKTLILQLLMVVIIPCHARAVDYCVDIHNGRWDNDGRTPDTAWQKIITANRNLKAGDTVYIREGVYEGADNQINPLNSGKEGAYITYRNYKGETVVIRGTEEQRLNACFWIEDKSHIKISGLVFDGLAGGEQWGDYRYIKEWGRIIRSNHVIVENCSMSHCEGWWGIMVDPNSHFNIIRYNEMHYCGYAEPPADDDYGNGIGIFGNYNLVEGNVISHAGHNLVEITGGSLNIVRGNDLSNPWGRCVGLDQRDDSPGVNNVIESNRIRGAGNYHDNFFPNPGIQINQTCAIVRFNEIADNYGHGIMVFNTVPVDDQTNDQGSYTRIVHNTVYANGYNDRNITDTGQGVALYEWSGGIRRFRKISVVNNLFAENLIDGVLFYNTREADHIVAGNATIGGSEFISATDLNFHLRTDSPAKDTGMFLTVTTAAGQGDQVPVENAGYFTDGFGIVEGDLIRLAGSDCAVRVKNVKNNIITVSYPLSWQRGEGVAYAYAGGAPDIGAHEYDGNRLGPVD